MRENDPSVTAEATLVFRAVEARRQDGVCDDKIAVLFLHPRSTVIGRTWIPEPVARWLYNLGLPGMQGYIVARTRYLDDHLQEKLDEGLAQVVVLGAGFDSRGYRFDALKTDARIFEVDHPATQRAKQEKLQIGLGGIPAHVKYVPVDFVKDSLQQRLVEHGYNPDCKTLFIWEGVTYYITADAVDNVLAFVRDHSGSGSSIIFDYIYPSVVEGTCPRREAKLWRKTMIPRNEALMFGIEEGEIEEFLGQRGFHRVTNVTHTFLKEQYFTGRNKCRKISPIFGIASASVNNSLSEPGPREE